jgi:hypothetical protein
MPNLLGKATYTTHNAWSGDTTAICKCNLFSIQNLASGSILGLALGREVVINSDDISTFPLLFPLQKQREKDRTTKYMRNTFVMDSFGNEISHVLKCNTYPKHRFNVKP